LKCPPPTDDAAATSLDCRLIELAHMVELEWGLKVEWSIKSAEVSLSGRLSNEMDCLIHEALANSARHAGATQVFVEIDVQPDQIHLRVQDNGRGFAFQGRYDLDQLTLLGWGPQSLMGRIAALGGQLTLESSRAGACLEITVPRGEV